MQNNYIIYNGELYHYGVPGMKWGHRRAQRKIDILQRRRRESAAIKDEMDAEDREMYSKPKQAKRLQKALAANKAMHETSEVKNKYAIEKQKVKLDKKHKQTDEYRQAKAAYNKQRAQQYIYGKVGHHRIETLKNSGYSERRAKGKVAVGQMLMGVTYSAAVLGTVGFIAKSHLKIK